MKLEHTCSITRRHTAQLIAATIFKAHRQVILVGVNILALRLECTTKVQSVEEE